MIDIKVLASSSKGNCYRVTDGSSSILLEAGIRYKDIQRKLDFQTRDIVGCLVTHEHKDHSKAISEVARAGMDVYMSAGTKEATGTHGHRIKEVKAKEQFTVGTWRVLPFDVQHDVSDPLGFLLQNKAGERLLFATDTFYIRYRFKGLTHVMIETNYSTRILEENIKDGVVPHIMKKRLMRSHFSLENVKDFLRANDLSKLQETWLIHLSDNNSDEELFKREVQSLTGKPVYIA